MDEVAIPRKTTPKEEVVETHQWLTLPIAEQIDTSTLKGGGEMWVAHPQHSHNKQHKPDVVSELSDRLNYF